MYGLVCLSLRNLTQPWNLVHAPLVSVLSYLQPRFAYILDHYEHARSRRRAPAAAKLVCIYIWVGLAFVGNDAVKRANHGVS